MCTHKNTHVLLAWWGRKVSIASPFLSFFVPHPLSLHAAAGAVQEAIWGCKNIYTPKVRMDDRLFVLCKWLCALPDLFTIVIHCLDLKKVSIKEENTKCLPCNGFRYHHTIHGKPVSHVVVSVCSISNVLVPFSVLPLACVCVCVCTYISTNLCFISQGKVLVDQTSSSFVMR